MINKYYIDLNADNFVYFFRELEFRYNTRDMNSKSKLIELNEIFEFYYSKFNYEFYEINELNDYNKENYINLMKMKKVNLMIKYYYKFNN